MPLDSVMLEIRKRAMTAEEKFGPFTSSHEGLGVLLEEFEELKQAIRANKSGSVEWEAMDVAAVAMRIAHCCELQSFRKRSSME